MSERNNIICNFYRFVVFCSMSGIRKKLHQMIDVSSLELKTESAGDDMNIGIIGAGKVGCSMGKYMKEQGLTVAGYFSRHRESSEHAGTFTETKVFEHLEDMIQECDILCIATPDDVIGVVWEELRQIAALDESALPFQNKIICHFSGSLSSAVFSGIEDTGAVGCSVHPMYAFSDKFTSFQKLNTVWFTMEGQEEALSVMEKILTSMGNQVLKIASDKKALYHCSASIVSNFVVALVQTGLDMLERCGISEKMGRELFGPLICNNIESMLCSGCEAALTGPIERNDCQTVKKHLEILCAEYGKESRESMVYRLLGGQVLSVAGSKNPQRDYKEMKSLFAMAE